LLQNASLAILLKNSMKKILFSLLFLSALCAMAQNSNDIDAMRRQVEKQRASLDSSRKRTDSLLLQQGKYFDSVNMANYMEQNTRNLNSFMKSMKEREKKENKRMWIRLGLGVFFLAILVVSFIRRRKAKKATA
jgi:hypothetical protein